MYADVAEGGHVAWTNPDGSGERFRLYLQARDVSMADALAEARGDAAPLPWLSMAHRDKGTAALEALRDLADDDRAALARWLRRASYWTSQPIVLQKAEGPDGETPAYGRLQGRWVNGLAVWREWNGAAGEDLACGAAAWIEGGVRLPFATRAERDEWVAAMREHGQPAAAGVMSEAPYLES